MTVFSPLHHTGSAVPSGNPLLCLAVKQGKKNTKYVWGNNHKMWKHMNYILNLWDSVWFTLKTSQPGGDYLDWVLLLCELKLFNHSCNTNVRPGRERNLGMKKNNTTKETWRTWFCSFSLIAAKIIHQVHDLKNLFIICNRHLQENILAQDFDSASSTQCSTCSYEGV